MHQTEESNKSPDPQTEELPEMLIDNAVSLKTIRYRIIQNVFWVVICGIGLYLTIFTSFAHASADANYWFRPLLKNVNPEEVLTISLILSGYFLYLFISFFAEIYTLMSIVKSYPKVPLKTIVTE